MCFRCDSAVGQLTAKTDFAGRTTHYAYDQRGRLTQKTPDASLGEAAVSFSYPNELTKISTRGSIQNIYKYDPQRGCLNSVQTNNGTINYGYDAEGNRTGVRITGKDGGVRETDYSYDALNRVSSVSRTGVGTLATYTYDAIGNISQVTRANGVISTFGYDDLHRLTAIQHKKGTEVLSQFNYALSADGKRNTLQEYLKYPAGQPVSEINRTVFYGYDNAGRLTAEQRQSTSTLTAGGTQKNTARTVWTYDKVGNRLTQAVSSYDGLGIDSPNVLKSTFNTSYLYNINDWLTSTTSVRNDDTGESTFVSNFEYNANGSQTAVTSNVGKPDETRVPYFYDFEQKLTGIGNPTDPIHHNYWYNADGNRIAESNTNSSGTDVRNYLVDPNNSNAQILEEYDNTNKLLAHYDWNDAELLREATWNANTNAYDIREPLTDGHNNVRQLLDSTGSVSDLYSFDAWGNPQENVGSSVNPYRYNSQRLDASGLYYLRARQYASGTGRFLTHDPLMGNMRNPITKHRYLYAGDDAVNMFDPSGKFSLSGVTQSIAISTAIGSISGTAAFSALGASPWEGAIVGGRIGLALSYSDLRGKLPVAIGMGFVAGAATIAIDHFAQFSQGRSFTNDIARQAYNRREKLQFIRGFAAGSEGVAYQEIYSGAVAPVVGFVSTFIQNGAASLSGEQFNFTQTLTDATVTALIAFASSGITPPFIDADSWNRYGNLLTPQNKEVVTEIVNGGLTNLFAVSTGTFSKNVFERDKWFTDIDEEGR